MNLWSLPIEKGCRKNRSNKQVMIASNKESSGKDTFPACCQRTVLAVKSPTLTISAKKRERTLLQQTIETLE